VFLVKHVSRLLQNVRCCVSDYPYHAYAGEVAAQSRLYKLYDVWIWRSCSSSVAMQDICTHSGTALFVNMGISAVPCVAISTEVKLLLVRMKSQDIV
jgi:hypothetical protein